MKRIRLAILSMSQESIDEMLERNPNLSEEDRVKVVEEIRKNGVFSFKKALLSVMRSPLDPRNGVSIEEIERSLPIIEEIKRVEENGVLELDDKEFEYIEKKMAATRVTNWDERWVTLKHTIKNATKDLLDVDGKVEKIPT